MTSKLNNGTCWFIRNLRTEVNLMQSKLSIEIVYSEEHMIEVGISVANINISASISCYTQIETLQTLGCLCEKFMDQKEPFVWNIGCKEYSYFEMKVHQYDKYGHVKVELLMLSDKKITKFDYVLCKCCLMFELGQISEFGKEVLKLKHNDYNMPVVIKLR